MRKLFGSEQKTVREERDLPLVPFDRAGDRRMTQMGAFRADELVVIVHRTQVVLVDCCADGPAQVRTSLLVGSKMYSAVNARVGNIIGDLLKRGVLQDDAGHRRIRQRDRMRGFAVNTPQHFRRRIGCTAVV